MRERAYEKRVSGKQPLEYRFNPWTNNDIFSLYALSSTKEECEKTTYSAAMEQLCMAMLKAFARFVAVISELDTYFRILATAGILSAQICQKHYISILIIYTTFLSEICPEEFIYFVLSQVF